MYRDTRGDPARYNGSLPARSGTEGSTRAREGSYGYARSAAGRGYLPGSTGAPSSAYDRTESRSRAPRRHSDWHDDDDDDDNGPHVTARGDSRYPSHATSANGRGFHDPPSVRINTSENDDGAFRSKARRAPSTHAAPSYSARHSAAPSLSSTRPAPPPRRPMRSAIHTDPSSRTSDATHAAPHQRTHRPGPEAKKVRFERPPPRTRTSLTTQSPPPSVRPLRPPAREHDSVSDLRRQIDIPPPVDVPAVKKKPPRRKHTSVVALLWRAVRRLLPRKRVAPVRLHALLLPPAIARPAPLSWDVRRSPLLSQAMLTGMSGLTEPATSPPTTSMRLLVDVPGLIDAQWSMTVFPSDSSRAGNADAGPPAIRCIDVLHALHGLLQRRIKEHEYWALEKPRRERVSRVFWDRCAPLGGAPGAGGGAGGGRAEARFGVRRIDLLDGWGWGGLSAAGQGEWIVRFRGREGA